MKFPPPSATASAVTKDSAPESNDRLSIRALLDFGSGGVAYNLGVDAIKNLANPVYNILLGLNPAWIGTAMMLARIWDAITDPIMGTVSDNCRSSWGRRRPFILAGAVLCAITFPLIWMAPRDWGEGATLGYFLVTSILFYTSFTIYSVPYMTLSLELTPSYAERTRISAVRTMFAAVSGIIVAWVFRISQLDYFDDPLTGIQVSGIVIGVIFLLSGLPPALWCKERYIVLARNQPKRRLLETLKVGFGQRAFRQLMLITLLIILGFNTFNAIGIYVNTYFVCSGDLKLAGTLQGLTGTVMVVGLFTGIPLVAWLSNRYGKVFALQCCLGLGIIGSISKWFLFSPDHPYWQLIVPLFIAPCSAGFWVVVNSMKADACDYDELEHGLRREGAFASISAWLQKFSAALTFSLSGLLLVVIGFNQELGGDQSESTIFALRFAFSFAPIAVFTVCMFITARLPFTPDKMREVRHKLEERRSVV